MSMNEYKNVRSKFWGEGGFFAHVKRILLLDLEKELLYVKYTAKLWNIWCNWKQGIMQW